MGTRVKNIKEASFRCTYEGIAYFPQAIIRSSSPVMPPKPAAATRPPIRIAEGSTLPLANPADVRRVEHVIAVPRVLVSIGIIEVVRVIPIGGSQQSDLVSTVIVAYSGF